MSVVPSGGGTGLVIAGMNAVLFISAPSLLDCDQAIEDVNLPKRYILKMILKYMDKVFTVIFVCRSATYSR